MLYESTNMKYQKYTKSQKENTEQWLPKARITVHGRLQSMWLQKSQIQLSDSTAKARERRGMGPASVSQGGKVYSLLYASVNIVNTTEL